MEKMNDLRDLLKHEIQDLYSAEEQIISALPKMMGKATNKELKATLARHLDVTERQKHRLDQVQQLMGAEDNRKKGFLSGIFGGDKHTCKAMEGIIEEGNRILAEDMSAKVRDAAIIACAQKVEHYEICGYGTARTYARELGLEKVALLLETTLNEEYEADDMLTALAISKVNPQAETKSRGSGRAASEAAGRGSRQRVKTEELEPVASRGGSTSRSTSGKSQLKEAGSSGNIRASASRTPSENSRGGKKTSVSGSRSSSRNGAAGGRSSKGR